MPQLVETFQLCRLKDTTWDDFFARATLRGKKLRAACRLGPISSRVAVPRGVEPLFSG